MTKKKSAWEIIHISSGKREHLCDSESVALNLLSTMKHMKDHYRVQEVHFYREENEKEWMSSGRWSERIKEIEKKERETKEIIRKGYISSYE